MKYQVGPLKAKIVKKYKPKLVKKDVTRFYQVPIGPFKKSEDVVKSFGYELKRELDRGGFGVVYIAKDLRKNIDVACKAIEIEPMKKSALEENKNELLVLEKVRHPYVIPVYCHFIVQGEGNIKMYIFMALADGGNLYKFLKKRGSLIDEQSCKLYYAQILSGINHMHLVGIAHRDIKLQNVLLCSNKSSISGDYLLVVTDFGLSKSVPDRSKLQRSICGTPIFMAPELLLHQPYDAFAVDIWALGISLYMMLSMDVPFDYQKPEKIVANDMLKKNWSFQGFKSQPSAEVKDLISRMLEPDPKNRIKMMEIIKHPWIEKEYILAKAVSKSLKAKM
ncbi:CBL-interacting serine/threonine-protein kinase 13 [Sarcoptes scabiei]|uniref:CBL-interacting serine/threonine-protein kinase 13 n=1 Tax=Sarcoptes scabiei TaxID=52283 RepID=A0A131ZXX0_SARSC|nr:CBL-interacting serine/threonine-protein kinase 13 [Sarcoptes scabiei]KPM02950.1 hypothetical protein QR98_0013760 [Sarcoptes scabiei]